MKCPRCGEDTAYLVGLAAGAYPAVFRCNNRHGEFNFSTDTLGVDPKEADRECREAAASSAAAAARWRSEP